MSITANKQWIHKSPDDIVADVNAMLTTHWNCKCSLPNSILLPWKYVRRKNEPLPGLWFVVYRWPYKLVKLRKQRRPRFARGFRV